MNRTLNIKNPEVYDLARRIADKTGQSMTEVVRDALRTRLDIVFAADRVDLADELIADIQRRAAHRERISDADLFDERTGLPR